MPPLQRGVRPSDVSWRLTERTAMDGGTPPPRLGRGVPVRAPLAILARTGRLAAASCADLIDVAGRVR